MHESSMPIVEIPHIMYSAEMLTSDTDMNRNMSNSSEYVTIPEYTPNSGTDSSFVSILPAGDILSPGSSKEDHSEPNSDSQGKTPQGSE